jgi:hypothetical protein
VRRRLGAGLLNIEKGNFRQGDLFDEKTEKAVKLEKVILDINQKFPDATLHRTRVKILS